MFTSLKISQNGKTSIFNIDLSQSFKSGLTTAETTDNITASSITGNYTNEQSESFDIKTQKAIVKMCIRDRIKADGMKSIKISTNQSNCTNWKLVLSSNQFRKC